MPNPQHWFPVRRSTAARGASILLDDPHNVIKAESDLEREKTDRLNDERSAIVVIMQRLHQGDVSGDILSREANYCHLMIPRSVFESQSRQSCGLDRRHPQTGESHHAGPAT